jgi:5-oxoprolinase (ATP-hydrolysing) subunit A
MIDVNCDLGEGEPMAKTRRLLRWVTSANIACGGHAGNTRTMRSCLRLCAEAGVNAGAHPGFVDREGFGRREFPISASEFESLIDSQAGDLKDLADQENISIAHIKLHGALYHVVERDEQLSRVYAKFVRERFPGIRIIASPKGSVIPIAKRLGVKVWGEIFADRAYAPDGDLVARSQPGAVLRDVAQIRMRMARFLRTNELTLEDGRSVKVAAQTSCIHADSPGALRIARLLSMLAASGPRSCRR